MTGAESSWKGTVGAPVVTVVVPVYDVEQYLDECMSSVLKQTHEHLDVILVDDGSPDNSGSMCDRWATEDERVRVVHKPNGGLSSARNAGLDLALGQYITFVDSDDIIAPDMVEHLLALAEVHRADLVVSDFEAFHDGSPAFSQAGGVIKIGTGTSLLPDVVCGRINWAACDKLYRSHMFEGGLRFTEGALYEDVEFTPKAFVRAKVAVLTPWRLYGYRQRPQSIMGVSSRRVSPDLIRMLRSAISTVKGAFSRDDPAYEALMTAYILHASKKLEWMDPENPGNDDFRRAYQSLVRDYWAEVSRFDSLSLAYRAGLLLSMLSPKVFSLSVSRLRTLKRSRLGKLVRRSSAGTPAALRGLRHVLGCGRGPTRQEGRQETA